MKNIILKFVLISFASTFLRAQTFHISGNISTQTEAVQNAKIIFIETNDSTKKYETLSDEYGNYSIGITTSIENTETKRPAKFILGQNYPNPFSDETAISYKLGESSNVSLTIYDILGER